MNMMNATKQALIEAGFPAFTVRKVLGRGKGNVDFRVIQGARPARRKPIARLKDDGPMFIPKRMMNVIVPDENVPKLIETIIQVNRTNKRGDGKIFRTAHRGGHSCPHQRNGAPPPWHDLKFEILCLKP